MQKLLLLLLLLSPLNVLAVERVAVWAYQPSPPFASEHSQGLSEALVQLLNEHSTNQKRFDFQLTQLPRKRLDARLADNEPGVLLWATPEFFPARLTAGAHWTLPLLCDTQDFISRSAAPFDYDGPQSLHGRRLGGILGHRYTALEEDIGQGLIHREDVHSDLQNLNKLLSERIDVALMPRSAWLFYSVTEVSQAQLYLGHAVRVRPPPAHHRQPRSRGHPVHPATGHRPAAQRPLAAVASALRPAADERPLPEILSKRLWRIEAGTAHTGETTNGERVSHEKGTGDRPAAGPRRLRHRPLRTLER